MDIKLELFVIDGYDKKSIKEISVSIDTSTINSIQKGTSALFKRVDEEKFINFDINDAADIYFKFRLKNEIEAAVLVESKETHKSWKLSLERDEAKRNEGRMRCQLDGLIKGLNPDFKCEDETSVTTED